MRQSSSLGARRGPSHETELLEGSLYGSAREFLDRPSKGLRARLVQICYAIAGGAGDAPAAAVDMIELLHSGSLIVDDIQDGADVRRGGPALHHLIGMPRALNIGNWLYFVALTCLDELVLDDERARLLNRATHQCLVDCHEGQSLDLALKVSDVEREQLGTVVEAITQLKTAAPMGLAARVGATAAGAPPSVVDALATFGRQLGQALQMLDDLGSTTAPERQHKGVEDLRNQRVSWVWSWAGELIEPPRFRGLIARLFDGSDLGSLRECLADIVEPLGRARVRDLLASAEGGLCERFPRSSTLDLVRAELARLERSYG